MASLAAVADPPNWIDRLTAFLRNEDHVEAILVDSKTHKVSVATLGEVDAERLNEKLTAVLRNLDASHHAEPHPNGAISVRQLPSETLIEKPSCPTAPLFWKWREFTWPEPEEIEKQSREEWQTLAIQATICGVALASGWALSFVDAIPNFVSIALYLVSLIAGGWDAAIDAFGKIRERQLDIHFLMLAVAAGAVAIGAWTEGALLLFLFSLSGALEHYALHRTHREINSLTKAAPKTATVVGADGQPEEINVALIDVGDVVEVKPDELFSGRRRNHRRSDGSG